MIRYVAFIHKDPDSDYGVTFPDFPGCVSAATCLRDLPAAAREALSLHIEGMLEEGLPLPDPTPFQDVPVTQDIILIEVM